MIAMWYFTSLFLQNVLGYGALRAGLGQTPAAVTFVVIAIGIGLVFPTLMATATADAPEGDAGIIGGLANTASQAGASVGLAVLATVAGSRTGTAGYDLVFLVAAGLGAAIAAVSLLLPWSAYVRP